MSLKTVAFTILVLTGLEAILSSDAASGRIGSAFSSVSSGIQYLVSPAYPLIPDLRLSAADRPHPPHVATPQEQQDQQNLLQGLQDAFGSPLLSVLNEGSS